jgi:alpha-tubulin suppressor-like RCC1 family protein
LLKISDARTEKGYIIDFSIHIKEVDMKTIFAIFAFSALSLISFLLPPVTAQTSGWGLNQEGQLGIGSIASPQPDPLIVTSMPDATAISGSLKHTLFLKADGTLAAAGANEVGQLGIGSLVPRFTVVTPLTDSSMKSVIQIAAGFRHSVALRADRTVYSWGVNDKGQLGVGQIFTHPCQCAITPLKTLVISDVVQIGAGTDFTIALKADGTVWGWGANLSGQLGNGSTATSQTLPAQIGVGVAGFNNIIAVSAGASHAIALKSDGTVWVWGRNNEGQLGNGTIGGNGLLPQQSPLISGIVQISAGSAHNIAFKNDGRFWAWGSNASGQFGDGTIETEGCRCVGIPQQNSVFTNLVEIEALGSGTFARLSDGSVWAWGANLAGEVGNGTITSTGCQCEPSPLLSSAGTGNSLISSGSATNFTSIPSFTTPTGANVRRFGKNVSLVFHGVTTAGTTGYTGINPAATGLNVPAGYTIQNSAPAYDITSAAVAGKNYVCLNVSSEYDPWQFALLKILHEEGPNLVDRTTASVFIKRQVCAEAPSFSRFVVAKGTAPTPAAVTITGRVATAAGQGVSNAPVELSDGRGGSRMVRTTPFGYYSFTSVPITETYLIVVTAKGRRVTPQTLTVIGDLEVNFTAQ